MASHEDLFESSVLQVVVPPPSIDFPSTHVGDQAAEWISHARSADRQTVFFDENLDFFLAIQFPEDNDPPPSPPPHLLSFLAHLQISYETSYISPATSDPPVARLSMPPPRNSSVQRNRPTALLAASSASLPPNTPHPIPSAAPPDLQYVHAQGTPLVSGIWGESDSSNDTNDTFALLWDAAERAWLAVYKMSILVLFMPTKVSDPLLSITVSATLRNKPLAITPSRAALGALIDASGVLQAITDHPPSRSNGVQDEQPSSDSEDEDIMSGLQEVNLLEGLATGPTFSDPGKRLSLPSTRLGSSTRMHAFSLGPVPFSNAPSQHVLSSTEVTSPPVSGTLPRAATLRKSFRKTLKTHMGFRVRMRTVFVPYFLLPQKGTDEQGVKSRPLAGVSDSPSKSDEDLLEERDQREAGNDEHTVVLSVEVENLFDQSPSTDTTPYHFKIEGVDVSISGTGASAAFIGWGNQSDVFPLSIGPREQVNLLYAVSFLRGPEVDEFSLARPPGTRDSGVEELHRAVTINLTVCPFDIRDDLHDPAYPTHAFPSRWNCVLDLASSSISQQKKGSVDLDDDTGAQDHYVLPTPASPFPTAPLAPPTRNLTPLITTRNSLVPLTAVAGNKRHTFSAFDSSQNEHARMPRSPMNYHSPTSMLNPQNQTQQQSVSSPTLSTFVSSSGQTITVPRRASYIPPSLTFQTSFTRSPPSYPYNSPIASPPPPHTPVNHLPHPHPLATSYTHVQTDSVSTINEVLIPATPSPSLPHPDPHSATATPTSAEPRTPAYPAYPSSPVSVPPTPFWQTPLAQQSSVGPSVDIRRERGGAVPQTPGPTVGGFGGLGGFSALGGGAGDAPGGGLGGGGGGDDEPIVVSVGLLAPGALGTSGAGRGAHAGAVYPLEQFTLDIFVFNQSSWTRRFEIHYPEERRRRGKKSKDGGGKGEAIAPRTRGIIPLENRVRVGPLLPSTCQSVRMDFLALSPGVHPIEALVLTDVQSHFTMYLRNVIDIIVDEPRVDVPHS